VSPDVPSGSRNLNQSAYKGKKTHRPGTSDSSRCLLPPNAGDSPSISGSFSDSFSNYQDILALSSVYLNYQHSLNSLVDIIDRVLVCFQSSLDRFRSPFPRMTVNLSSNFTVSYVGKSPSPPQRKKHQCMSVACQLHLHSGPNAVTRFPPKPL
jgi:hypothetical protein